MARTAGGTARLRCRACEKTFTPAPNLRLISSEKEQLIVDALAERIPQYSIARTFGVSQVTMRKIRKKDRQLEAQGVGC